MNRDTRTNEGATNGALDLLKKIQALAFAKVETELYLDSHPECAVALDYYKSLIQQYNQLTGEYESIYGPLRQENVNGESWSWTDSPWPWQLEGNGRMV